MNVFDRYLNGELTAQQLRALVSTEGTAPQSLDQWTGAAFDGRRMTTYDHRIDDETHLRNTSVGAPNAFSQVSLDPVADQLRHDRNYGGSNVFSQVRIAEYDPVLAQREHDITTQQGRYAVERPQSFSEVAITPSVTHVDPLDDTRQYLTQTTQVEDTLRRDLDYEAHYNPATQRPLW